ncbi:hypothetical protein QC760_004754 [Botrytis cinerea]
MSLSIFLLRSLNGIVKRIVPRSEPWLGDGRNELLDPFAFGWDWNVAGVFRNWDNHTYESLHAHLVQEHSISHRTTFNQRIVELRHGQKLLQANVREALQQPAARTPSDIMSPSLQHINR